MKEKMIDNLPEGKLRNAKLQLRIDNDQKFICACCICSMEVNGGAPYTATSKSGKMLTDDLRVIVGSLTSD